MIRGPEGQTVDKPSHALPACRERERETGRLALLDSDCLSHSHSSETNICKTRRGKRAARVKLFTSDPSPPTSAWLGRLSRVLASRVVMKAAARELVCSCAWGVVLNIGHVVLLLFYLELNRPNFLKDNVLSHENRPLRTSHGCFEVLPYWSVYEREKHFYSFSCKCWKAALL